MQFVMARGALQKELAFVQGVVERKIQFLSWLIF